MKLYEVWMEGYVAQGSQQGAKFMGNHRAESFQEACLQALREKGHNIDKYYDAENNTFWGMRFFSNETEARKSFG